MVSLKLLIFSVKLLAKLKPGAKVTLKMTSKGRTIGAAAVDPTGATLFYVALSSLNGFAIMLAVGFILKQLTNRGLVFAWDKGLTEAFPDYFNSTSETGLNLVSFDLGAQDIPTLVFKPTREKVVSEVLESTVELKLGRPLTPLENVALEVMSFGLNFLPAPIAVPLVGVVSAAGILSEPTERGRSSGSFDLQLNDPRFMGGLLGPTGQPDLKLDDPRFMGGLLGG